MKPFVPFLLTGVLSIGTYLSLSLPLSSANIDTNFYENSDLFNRFEKSDSLFSSFIENDPSGIKEYFLNGSFSLYWGDGDNWNFSNAFLLNILLPDDMNDDDPGRFSYVPKYYAAGDELVFLLGTSFDFVKKLFDKVSDWSSEVNDSSSSILLSDDGKSSNGNSYKFFMSHPKVAKGKKERVTQDVVYKLKDDSYAKMYDLENPFYFEIEKQNVEVVYAAQNLEINEKLLKKNVNNSIVKKIEEQDYSSIQWKKEIKNPIDNKKYKFSVDFAVLKVKVKMNKIQSHFLSYLMKLYKKEIRIPSIFKGEFFIEEGKTKPVYLGGWSRLSEKEEDEVNSENLLVKAEVKESKKIDVGNKLPSDINENNFSEFFDFELYDKYSEMLLSTKSTTYSPKTLKFYPNDSAGVLVVDYEIQKNNRSTGIKRRINFAGLKKTDNYATESSGMEEYFKEKQKKDESIMNFLEASPKGIAKWKEFEIKHTYFNNINIFQKMLKSYATEDKNYADYLDISHNLDVPSLDVSAKGMLAMVQDQKNDEEKFMLGMYNKTKTWRNFLSDRKSVAKIMMFISPWRYDLFNHRNKLSKPTLADSLCAKGLGKKIIQINRFAIDVNNCNRKS